MAAGGKKTAGISPKRHFAPKSLSLVPTYWRFWLGPAGRFGFFVPLLALGQRPAPSSASRQESRTAPSVRIGCICRFHDRRRAARFRLSSPGRGGLNPSTAAETSAVPNEEGATTSMDRHLHCVRSTPAIPVYPCDRSGERIAASPSAPSWYCLRCSNSAFLAGGPCRPSVWQPYPAHNAIDRISVVHNRLRVVLSYRKRGFRHAAATSH